MKRKLLFSAAMLVMAVGAMAQSDITPSRYDFANLPEGEYLIDGFNTGWGPGNLEAAYQAEHGYVNLTGGPNFGSKDTESSKNFQSGLQIVDMGTDVGKVLCYKGVNCDDEILSQGHKAIGNIPDWPQLAFYSTASNTPSAKEDQPGQPVRVTVLFKAIENEPDPAGAPVNNFEVKNASENFVQNECAGPFSSSDMMVKDLETEEYYEMNEGWMRVTYDVTMGTTPEGWTGNPLAFSVKLTGQKLNAGAILIKEIKFAAPSDGTLGEKGSAIIEKGLTLKNGSVTGFERNYVENNEISCTVSDDLLTVSNVKAGENIEVYAATGALVASQIAASNASAISLAGKGFYIVKVGSVSKKIVNN